MMKKILLGTTAIVGASVLLASAVQAAEKPKVEVSGFARFEAWQVDQDFDKGDNGAPLFEMDDIEVHFKASATADNGLEYGVHIELQEGNTNSVGYDEGNVYFAGNWGRVELGSQDAAHNNYKVGGYAISADRDGAWDGNTLFETTNATYIGTDLFGGDDANKVSYYTPTFNGLTVGVSYMPNSESQFNSGIVAESVTATDFLTGGNGNMNNQVGIAAHYVGSFSDVGVTVDARYARADYQGQLATAGIADREEASAFGAGGKLSYAGFSVAGSYNDLGDSGLTAAQEAGGGDTGSWWDVGVAYGTGPYKVSLIYMESEANDGTNGDEKTDYLSFGAGYTVAPGLDVYASYQYVDMDSDDATRQNEANMIMVGTHVSF